MLKQWQRQLNTLSGNLTTNECMPQFIVDKLLEEDVGLKEGDNGHCRLLFEDVVFPELENELSRIKGLNILAGLQSRCRKNCLTLF